jgi:hypothetical protein
MAPNELPVHAANNESKGLGVVASQSLLHRQEDTGRQVMEKLHSLPARRTTRCIACTSKLTIFPVTESAGRARQMRPHRRKTANVRTIRKINSPGGLRADVRSDRPFNAGELLDGRLGPGTAAITRLSKVPGFSETPTGFHIDEYQVDKYQWVEGYSTLANA